VRTQDGEIFHLPDALAFHYPTSKDLVDDTPIEIQESESKQYRQLVCWCLIQRYWYYVICEPKVKDIEYDLIEGYVKELEECIAHSQLNPYSPSKSVGSDLSITYPRSVWMMFSMAGRESLKKRLLNVEVLEHKELKQKNLFDAT
jgi:NAD-dependent DNA ligase